MTLTKMPSGSSPPRTCTTPPFTRPRSMTGSADGGGAGLGAGLEIGAGGGRPPPHTAIHGQVCQPVSMPILFPQDMLDLKMVELRDPQASLLVQRAELRA